MSSPQKSKLRTENEPKIKASSAAGPQVQSSSDDDDEEELLREQQRLAKLKERNPTANPVAPASSSTPSNSEPAVTASTNSGSAYNSDVLFRRHPPVAAMRGKAAPAVHNNLLTSKAHGSFMKTFFK